MARKLAFSIWLAWLVSPLSVFGLGLGDITLNSALNQPLDAQIELISVEPQDLASLEANIAPAEMFIRYGLDRPAYFSTISLQVEQTANGQYVIKATSSRSITEPFVTLLVEIDWDRGRLLREYTVLLDPPVFAAPTAQPAPSPAAPAPRSSTATSGTVLRTPNQPASSSTQRSLPTAPLGGEYRVQRNDTLWEIAQKTRPSGADINQTMIALFRANPSAFYGNINRLKAGVIMRIPDSAEVANLNRSETQAEVRRQMNEWRGAADSGDDAGRLRLVPADDTASSGAGTSDIDQRIAQDLADQTTENLQLKSQVEDLARELDDQQRLIQLKDDQLAQLQSQLESLGTGSELDPQIDQPVGDDPLAADPLADEVLVDDGLPLDDAGTDPTQLADTVEDTPTVVTPPPAVVSAPQADPTIVERLTELAGNKWLLIGAGVVFLGLGGMFFARRRREASEISSNLEALVADEPYGGGRTSTGTARMPAMRADEDEGFVVEESLTEDDYAATITEDDEIVRDLEATLPGVKTEGLDQTISGETAVNLENADPVAEADFHMAYGLFDQAAELLENALAAEPDRRDLKFKLAGVYFAWGNQAKFLNAAQEFRDSTGGADSNEWNEILIMGQQLCPDNDLFSGTVSGGEIDLELQETQITSGDNIDMLMGDDPSTETGSHKIELDDVFAAADAELAKGADETDFDLGAESQATEVFAQDDLVDQTDLLDSDDDDELLDLDLSGLDGLDGNDESPTAVERIDETIASTVAGLDLDPGATAELNLDDLGLSEELDATGTMQIQESAEAPKTDIGATAQIKVDAMQLSETEGLDLDLDSDNDEQIGMTSEMPTISTPTTGETGGGDLDDGQLFSDVFGDESEGRISDDIDLDTGDAAAELEQTGTQPLAAVDDLDLNVGDEEIDGGEVPTMEVTREMEATREMEMTGEMELTREMKGIDGDDDYTGTMKLPDSVEVTGTHQELPADDDFSGTIKLPEPDANAETMSEVGTKLDLARAYMDMGDPDGAKSILEEVLEEGTATQKSEASKLLESLP